MVKIYFVKKLDIEMIYLETKMLDVLSRKLPKPKCHII